MIEGEKSSYCERCKVTVTGTWSTCPLCQRDLMRRKPTQDQFPQIPMLYRQHSLFFRILLFLSVVSGIISLTINALLPQTGYWSLFTVAGILCCWLMIYMILRKRSNISKNIIDQVMVVSVLAILWDWGTGWHHWSLDFVFPCICVAAMIALGITAKILKLDVREYLIYLLIDALFGIIPLLFFVTGCLQVVLPTLICVASSLISLAGLLIFRGESMKEEMKRRLHL